MKKIILLHLRQWRENRKRYGVGMLAIVIIHLFLFLVTWQFKDSFSGDVNRGVFLLGLFVGGGLFASSMLRDITLSSKGIQMIVLPASASQKLLIATIYAIPLYLFFYIPAFYFTEGFFQWLLKRNITALERTDIFKNGFHSFFFTFVILQLLVLMGNLTFKRVAFLKTVILIISFFMIANELNSWLLKALTDERNINGGAIFTYFQFRHEGENIYVHLPKATELVVSVVFYILLPIILWYINYLKLKEIEL